MSVARGSADTAPVADAVPVTPVTPALPSPPPAPARDPSAAALRATAPRKGASVPLPMMFGAAGTAAICALLNQSLSDTLDLAYQTRQAHWNVKGRNFYALHLLFDQLYAQLSGFVDDFAERAVAIGGDASGTVRAAAAASRLADYPSGLTRSRDHVDALAERYAHYTRCVREAIGAVSDLDDKVTADLYTGVSRTMDKALWMLKAHQVV